MKFPEEHTLSVFDEVVSQRVPKILDSIGGIQRFSVKKSFVHSCISDTVFFISLFVSIWKSSRSSSQSFIIDIVEVLKHCPLTRDPCARQDSKNLTETLPDAGIMTMRECFCEVRSHTPQPEVALVEAHINSSSHAACGSSTAGMRWN